MFTHRDKENQPKYCNKGRILVIITSEGGNSGVDFPSRHFKVLVKVCPPGPGYKLLTEHRTVWVLIREAALYPGHQDSPSLSLSSLGKEVKV